VTGKVEMDCFDRSGREAMETTDEEAVSNEQEKGDGDEDEDASRKPERERDNPRGDLYGFKSVACVRT